MTPAQLITDLHLLGWTADQDEGTGDWIGRQGNWTSGPWRACLQDAIRDVEAMQATEKPTEKGK